MRHKRNIFLFTCAMVCLLCSRFVFAAESATIVVTVTVPSSAAIVYDPRVAPQKTTQAAENFTYSVYYYHPDGQPPDTAEVRIDGTSYDLSLSEGASGNGLYAYTTGLSSSASHAYSFAIKAQASADTISCPSVLEYYGPIICAPGAEVVVDDFNDTGRNTNSLGFWTDDDATCAVDLDTGGSHQLSWDDKTDYWYTALWDNQTPFDASGYNKLLFQARGAVGSELFRIELQDIYGKNEVLSSDYITLSTSWQEVVIPLDTLVFQGVDQRQLKAIVFLFKDSSSGTIFIDDIKFSYDTGLEYSPPIFAQQKLRSSGPVQIIGRHLFVDGLPFLVKAVGYQPTPVGFWPTEWNKSDTAIYQRDLPLLKAMGANAVKTWTKVTQELLDTATANDIRVCAGFWIDTAIDLSNATTRQDLINEFSDYVSQFKDHPAILMWVLGNEQNYYNGDNKDWYTLANEMAKTAYEAEGNSFHPVAVNNGGLNNIGYAKKGADDASLSYIDIWALNVYRGRTFGNLFHDLDNRTSKPIFIAEYGVDALNNASQDEDQPSQSLWDVDMYNELSYSGGCIGGAVMAYSDEWWKADNPSVHDKTGVQWSLSTQPDGYSNEEWYGIVSIADNGSSADIVTPRQLFADLAKRFKDTTRSFLNIIQPQAPSSLTATAEPAAVSLSWQASSTRDIAGYCIYRSSSPTSGFTRLVTTSASTTRYQDDKLPVTTYYYVVTAYDASRPATESASSNPASATVLNKAPVLSAIGDKQVNEKTTIVFQITATDDNADNLTYSASNLPSGASFDPSTQAFSWTPTHEDVGAHPGIHFEVSDGELTDSEDIAIEVKDITPPSAPTITSPASGYRNTDITELKGAAEPGSTIKPYNSGRVLSGTAVADANGNYTLRLSTALSEEAEYSLTTTATDSSNNTSAHSQSLAVAIDKTAPLTVSSGIDGLWHNSPVEVTLTASDKGAGVDKTYYSTDGSSPTLLYTAPFTISKEGTYTIKYYSTDKAGNEEPLRTAAEQVKIDKTPPACAIIINSGAERAESVNAKLNVSATDALSGMGAGSQMKFSNDDITYSAPEDYNTKKDWVLTDGNGTKTVYVKFKDVAGNWSDSVYDTIVLNKNLPKISAISPVSGVIIYADNRIKIEVTASDADGDTIEYQFVLDGASVQEFSSASSWQWQTDTADIGSHSVDVNVRDPYLGTDASSADYFVARKPVGSPDE